MDLAKLAAERLGVKNLLTISIEDVVSNLETALKTTVDIRGITAENLQARARGVILMGLSNATGYMVLSTGNKSEMTVGYATLYGDMCGGFNVLKGLWKTDVFVLSDWRNKNKGWKHALGPRDVEVIPHGILSRPPLRGTRGRADG
jgi:NAD+ synthase